MNRTGWDGGSGFFLALGLALFGCGGEDGYGEEPIAQSRQPLGGWTAVTNLAGTTTSLAAQEWTLGKTGLTVVDNHAKTFNSLAAYPAALTEIPGALTVGSGARMGAAFRGVQGPNVTLAELLVFTRSFIKSGNGYVIMQNHTWEAEFGTDFWWSTWIAPLGTGYGILGSPTASSTGLLEGDLDLYVTGTDSQLYINSYIHTGLVTDPYSDPSHPDGWGHINGYWSGFSSLNGVISAGTSPSAASYRYRQGTIAERDVFVRNTAGGLSWRYWKSGFGWAGWQTVASNTFVGSPVSARSGFAANAIDVFVLGTDGNIYRNRMTVTNPDVAASRTYTWSGYVFCGKPSGVTLTAENIAATGTDLLVRGTNGVVYRASGDCP